MCLGRARCLAGVVLLLASGCARWQTLPPEEALTAPGDGQAIELDAVPFFPQTVNQCGPAALATVLSASGVAVQPADLGDEVYIPGRGGSLQIEMQAAVRRFGRLAYHPGDHLDDLVAELRARHPVLVFHNLGVSWLPFWHYEVVIGFDPARTEFISRSGTTRRERTPAPLFLRTWNRSGRWALVVLRPGELPAGERAQPYLEAAAAFERSAGAAASAPAWAAATGRWPREPMAWLGLGNARLALGETGPAVRAYRTALAVRPGLVAARNNLALAMARAGCVAGARHELDTALEALDADDPLAPELERTRRELAAVDPRAPASPACGG